VTGKTGNAEVQAFYRHVNERIAEISARLQPGGALEILCECGEAGCTERVAIPASEYEALRAQPTHFALVVGHENSAVEDVIDARNGYLVVANYGSAATVARRTDPRAGSR
jgi:hypothetical protein